MEIGSEYHIDLSQIRKSKNSIYELLSDYACNYYDLGRSAIKSLFLCFDDGKGLIVLPEYICDSVKDIFPTDRVVYYRINDDFQIEKESFADIDFKKVSFFFLLHYFGTLQNNDVLTCIKELSAKHNFIIIEDTTHSILSSTATVGDYMVCSLRKWVPVSNGAVLYTNKNNRLPNISNHKKASENSKFTAMILKGMFLDGELDCHDKYRELFVRGEEEFDDRGEIYTISDLSAFLLGCFDLSEIKERRKENQRYICSYLSKKGFELPVSFKDNECPFTYPVFMEYRDDFRKYLINNNIYCAVHWPVNNEFSFNNYHAYNVYKKIISLPIDQRYDRGHMEYLVKCIDKYEG